MMNYKFKDIYVFAVAVLFIFFQVAKAKEISYEDFLQSYEDAVNSAMMTKLRVSLLPPEVVFFIVDLYEDDILNDFPTATKKQLTKILAKDIKSRTKYYEQNRTIFKAFILKVLEADIKNYPGEDSKIDVENTAFLSLMIMDTVTEIMRETIASENAPVDYSWKILNLKDAFRTVYFYCKYPKEMAPFLTEEMRVDVKEWLDSTATWGKWGFKDGDAKVNSSVNNDSVLKLEL